MRKGSICLVLVLLLGVLWLALGTAGADEKFVVEDGVLTEYKGTDEVVVIPDGVTTLGDGVFKDRDFLQEVTIPDGVVKIDRDAFFNCPALAKVNIGSGVRIINTCAFAECPAMEDLTLPDGIETIEWGAFSGNPARKYTAIDSATAKALSLAYDCFFVEGYPETALNWTYESVPNEDTGENEYLYTGVVAYARDKESNVPSVVVPEGVTEIREGGFSEWGTLAEVILPESLERIGNDAFQGCIALTEIAIPNKVTAIEGSAFENCIALEQVTVGSGVKKIGYNAFSNCKVMNDITLPDGIETIEGGAFSDNPARIYTGMNSATAKALSWADYYFCVDGNPNVVMRWLREENGYNEETGETLYREAGIAASAWNKDITSAMIPEGVTEIEEHGFAECKTLAEATLSESLKVIGSAAFQTCETLTEIEIPAQVTEIRESAFDSCSALKQVTVGSGVKKIGDNAFSNCKVMNDITLPDGIKTIEADAFSNNPARKYAALNSDTAKALSVSGDCFCVAGYPDVALRWNFTYRYNEETETNERVFTGVSARALDNTITTAIIPSGVTEIESGGFSECAALEKVEISDTVTVIHSSAFEKCDALKQVTLGSGLRKIEYNAFGNCPVMEDLTLPENIDIVEGGAFSENPALKYVTMNSTTAKALSVGDDFFHVTGYPDVALHWLFTSTYNDKTEQDEYEYTGIAAQARDEDILSARIPEGVTVIDENGFASCAGLANVELPKTLEQIRYAAFRECASLTAIGIPDSVTFIGGSAFYDCPLLSEVKFGTGLKTIDDGAFAKCPKMQDVTLPEDIERFGWQTFEENPARRYVALNSSTAKALGRNDEYFYVAGYPDVALRWLHMDTYNEQTEQDEITYTGVTACARNQEIVSAKIPEGVTEIEGNGFSGCSRLSEVDLPDSLKMISGCAFLECDALTALEIPDNVTEIGNSAFEDCAVLKQVTIGTGVKIIRDNAFAKCPLMKDITLPDGIETIEGGAFCDNPARKYATLNSTTAKALSRAYEYFCVAGYPDVNLRWLYEEEYNEEKEENEIRYTGVAASARTGTMTAVAIPEGVTEIEENGFSECEALAEIRLPGTLTRIGAGAFWRCSKLSEAEIPEGVTTIEASAFEGCTALKKIKLPETLTKIGSYAFFECRELEDQILPDRIKEIEWGAFDECPAKLYATVDSQTAKSLSDSNHTFCAPGEPDYALQYRYINEVYTLCLMSYTGTADTVLLPFHIEYICSYAFYRLPVRRVVISESVLGIDGSAFCECADLTVVELSYSISEISPYAFEYYNEGLVFYVYADTYGEDYVRENGFVYLYKGASLRVVITDPVEGIRVRIVSEDGAVREKEVIGGVAQYPSMISDKKYAVEVVNDFSHVLARQETFIQNGVNEVRFTLFKMEKVHAVVRDAETQENLTARALIRWYDEKGNLYAEGAELQAVPVETELTCQVIPDETLLRLYEEPETRQCVVTEEDTYLSCQLTRYATRTITGRVIGPDTSTVAVTQKTSQTRREFITTVKTDAEGRYEVTVPDLPAKILISAAGFTSQTLNAPIGVTDMETVTLEAVQGVRIVLDTQLRKAAAEGAVPETVEYDLTDAAVTVENITTGKTLADAILVDNTVIVPGGLHKGDSIRITVSGNAFADATAEFELENAVSARVPLTLVEKGGFRCKVETPYDGTIRLLMYDQDDKLAAFTETAGDIAEALGLEAGSYTAVLMGTSSFVEVPDNLLDLLDVARVEISVDVENGVISEESIGEIPELDDSEWYAIKPEEIVFKSSRSVVTPGKNYTISASALTTDDSITEIRWSFEIPEGSVYVDNTLSLNGVLTSRGENEGNLLTVAVNDPAQTVRFCLLPVTSGTQTVKGLLTYKRDGKTYEQKLPALTVEVEPLTLNAPAKTYKDRIHVYGIAPASSGVKVYDGSALIGEAEAAASGIWDAWVQLNNPGKYSRHRLYAVYTARNGYSFTTAAEIVTYQYMENPVSVSKVKMYTAAHEEDGAYFDSEQCVIFDFDNPGNTTHSYAFNPSLPNCYFLVLFNGDTAEISRVKLNVLCTDNSTRILNAEYDKNLGGWYAKAEFSGEAMPTGVTVQYYNGTEMILEECSETVSIHLDSLEEPFNGLQTFDLSVGKKISDALAYAIDRYNDSLLKLKKAVEDYKAGFALKDKLVALIRNSLITLEDTVPNEAALTLLGYKRCQLDSGEFIYFYYANGDLHIVIPSRNAAYRIKNFSTIGISLSEMMSAFRWINSLAEDVREAYKYYSSSLYGVLSRIEQETGVALDEHTDPSKVFPESPETASFWQDVMSKFKKILGKDVLSFLPTLALENDASSFRNITSALANIETRIRYCPMGETCEWLSKSKDCLGNAAAIQTALTVVHIEQTLRQLGAMLTGSETAYSVLSDLPSTSLLSMGVDIATALSDYFDAQCDCETLIKHLPFKIVTAELDPSGFVYEAVESNRVSGAKATVWQEVKTLDEYDEEQTEIKMWDAAEFKQKNPQTTDENGQFGWDVPNGKWIVRVEKSGYENAESEWMEVPPEWDDVRIPLVSTQAPEVLNVKAEENGYRVAFSQYIPEEGLDNYLRVTDDGAAVEVSIEAINAEVSPAGISLAKEFLVTPTGDIDPIHDIRVKVSGELVNYAGTPLGRDYQSAPLGELLTNLETETSLNMALGETRVLKVSLKPVKEAVGRKITAKVEGTAVSVSASALTDENGEATLTVSAMEASTATIHLEVSNSSLTADIPVTCVDTSDPVKEIQLEETLIVMKDTSWNLSVQLLPAEAAQGRTVNFTATGDAVTVNESDVADENGEAVLVVTAVKGGVSTVTANVADSELTAVVTVTCVDPDGMRVLRLPDSMERIEEEAFAETGAEIVIVPKTCTYIGSKAFADCPNLMYLVLPSDSGIQMEKDALVGTDAAIAVY